MYPSCDTIYTGVMLNVTFSRFYFISCDCVLSFFSWQSVFARVMFMDVDFSLGRGKRKVRWKFCEHHSICETIYSRKRTDFVCWCVRSAIYSAYRITNRSKRSTVIKYTTIEPFENYLWIFLLKYTFHPKYKRKKGTIFTIFFVAWTC